MTLTQGGFVPADRRGEADTGKANALASTTPPPAQPPYALIAAAGGAGLGAVFLIGKAMGRKG